MINEDLKKPGISVKEKARLFNARGQNFDKMSYSNLDNAHTNALV